MKPVGVVYADPPWAFRSKRAGGSWISGASQVYPVLGSAEVAAIPVASVCLPDAVCFLWVPTALKDEGLMVLKAWGFTYKTTYYWLKTGDRMGMGFWFRNAVEECLVGVCGKVTPFRAQVRNVLMATPGKHSEKPQEVRSLIETVTEGVAGERLEIFGRREVEGWRVVGLEVGNDVREPGLWTVD